jgi:hypothetical protein
MHSKKPSMAIKVSEENTSGMHQMMPLLQVIKSNEGVVDKEYGTENKRI